MSRYSRGRRRGRSRFHRSRGSAGFMLIPRGGYRL